MNDILWLHFTRPRTRWYEASDADREACYVAWRQLHDRALRDGAVFNGEWSIRGQSGYSTVASWTFTDVDAVTEHWARLVDAGYTEWFSTNNMVGAPAIAPSVQAPHITNWPRA